jgi:hypothetical protein
VTVAGGATQGKPVVLNEGRADEGGWDSWSC